MLDTLQKYRAALMLGLYVVVAFSLLLLERGREDEGYGVLGSVLFQAQAATQDLTHYGSGGLGDFWNRYLDLVRVGEENQRLRAELDRLQDENARLLGVMQENARLRSLVGFMESYPTLDLAPARVIAKDVSPYFRVTTIRIEASNSRVQVGQPVVSSAGVVGYVHEVSGTYAEVLLAVDPRSSIDVLVQRNRARGVLIGLGHDNDYSSRVAYLLRRDQVSEGDVVVTSGMGGRFPADLVVGRIAAIEERQEGLFQEVIVEPAVDFSRLEEVFVIVGEER